METLTKQASAALTKVDDFNFEDLDFIGQKYPSVSAGHKAIFYLIIAAASLPAQSAWAAMSLIIVPVSVSIAAAGMGLGMLFKSASEDSKVVDVDAEEVSKDTSATGESEIRAVGPATQLHAVDVTAETIQDEPVYESNPFASENFGKRREYYKGDVYLSPEDKAAALANGLEQVIQESSSALVATGSNTKRPMDIAKYMAMNPKPTLVSAVPRSGKGVVIAQMWREFKQLNPGGIVWVIQPKPHPNELGYWEGVDNFWGEMIEEALGTASEISRISKELTNFVNEWRRQPQRPKMLIIDEGVKIQSVLSSWYSSFLKPTVQVEASSGETDERFLYVVSQSPLVKDIGISTGNRASLQFLHIDKPGAEECLSVMRGSFNSIPEPEDGLYALSESPKQAIFYHTAIGEWHPMPAYPIYDRTLAAVSSASQSRQAEPVIYPQKNVWDFEPPAWDFGEEATTETPALDAKISEFNKYANEPRYQCVVGFLESLKKHKNGTQLSPSDFGKSTWASRWDGKEGGLKGRSGAAVGVFLRNAVKLGFLEQVGEKYEVRLS